MPVEFKNKVLESTKQLLSLSVDPQNLTEVNSDNANDTAKEQNENTIIKEHSTNDIEHSASSINVVETNITGVDHQQTKIIEFIDNKVDESCIQENKDPVVSVTVADLIKSNYNIIKNVSGFAPSVVGDKGNDFTLHSGLKVTVVKADKEKDDNKCEEIDIIKLSTIAVAEQDNRLPLGKGNTNLPTVTVVQTEKQKPMNINIFLKDTKDPVSNDCTVLSMKRPRRESKKLEDERDELPPSPRRKISCKYEPEEKKEKRTNQKKETSKKPCIVVYTSLKSGKKQKAKPIPDNMVIASEAINTKSKTKGKIKLSKTNPLNEKVPGWINPKPIHSYSVKRCLNKIRTSGPVSIDTFQNDSLCQHVEENLAQTVAIEKETIGTVPTPDSPKNTVASLSTIKFDSKKKQKLDLDINDISLDSADEPCMTQLQACSLMEDNVGLLSFSRGLELDELPITTFFTHNKVVSIENILTLKKKALSKNGRREKPKQPWRMDVKNEPNGDHAFKKTYILENTNQTPKDNLSGIVVVDSTKVENLANNNDEDEEQKAYREKLLSGYVKRPVVVDQNEYKQKMKELLKRAPKAAYKCKTCSSIFMSETGLLEHKEIHEEAAVLQRERGEKEGGTVSNAQTPKSLKIAPGVKVINPMYKTSNKGLMFIYASGNCFYKSWTTEDGRVAWICRTHHRCTATLHTKDDEIVAYNNVHTPRLNYKPSKNRKLGGGIETKTSNEENEESIKKINAKRYCNSLPQTQTNSAIKKYSSKGVIGKESSRDCESGNSDAHDSIKCGSSSKKCNPITRPKRENRHIPKRYETYIRPKMETSSPGQKLSEYTNSLTSTDKRGKRDEQITLSSKGVIEMQRSSDHERSGDSDANDSIKSGTSSNKCTPITRPKRENRHIPKRYEIYIGSEKKTSSPEQKHSENRSSLSSKGVMKKERSSDHERSGDSDANDSIKSGTSSNRCTPITRPKRENRHIPKRYEIYIGSEKKTSSPGQKHSENRSSLSSKGVMEKERSSDHERSGDSDANDSIKSGTSSNKCTPIARPKRENRQIPKRYEMYIGPEKKTSSPGQTHSEDRNKTTQVLGV